MIKIKDYIFNGNEIYYISQSDIKELHIMFKNNDDFFIKATFDDIEWNYPSKEIEYLYKRNEELETQIENQKELLRKQSKVIIPKNIEQHNEIVDLNVRIKELEEENRQLKELNVCVGCDNNPDYKSRIDKATEHLEESIYDYLKQDKDLDDSYNVMTCKTFKERYLIPVLKILKGEEK